jgi:hypothetical protein
MNAKDSKFSKVKPYVIGGVVGAIGIAIAGFSAGWVVTKGQMHAYAEKQVVVAFAHVCETKALASWKGAGKSVDKLGGWSNDTREALAKKYVPALPSKADYRQLVIDSCDDMLTPA